MAGILSEPLDGFVKELGAVVVGVVEISRPKRFNGNCGVCVRHMTTHSLGLQFHWL